MRTVDLIQRKRDGAELAPEEIEFLVDGYTSGEIPDYQMSAFLMAVFYSGMTDREVSRLTECMLRSGETADLSAIPGIKVDKHSTGGVGDKTSLVVAPLAAAAGVVVPMMSGRALGHTGGTLDKLESIPGFRTDLSSDEFQRQLAELGLCFIGQTDQFAPADRKLYALRDVTGTVESIPLIASSIMRQYTSYAEPSSSFTEGSASMPTSSSIVRASERVSSRTSSGPAPRNTSTDSTTSRALPTARPRGWFIAVNWATVATPWEWPRATIVAASSRARSRVLMNAPRPTLTSSTSA